MPRKAKKAVSRRQPKQGRAHHTVDAVLDAVIKILKREGGAAVTTNRIADVAGVSIGSVYQYFPNKRAIFAALHDRHVEQIAAVVEGTLAEHSQAPLETLLRALLDALIEAHVDDPELFELLTTEIPQGTSAGHPLQRRLHSAIRLAVTARAAEFDAQRDLTGMTFVLAHMLDALAHGVALARPKGLSLAAAKAEAVRALRVYLSAS